MFNYSFNKVVQFLFLFIILWGSPAVAGWQLEWIDTFDGTRVDRGNWTSQVQANYNAEVQCYTDDDSSANKNYDVSNGTLKIIARKQANNCSGLGGIPKSWTSGRLNSKDKREFLYGRIEARIRFHDLQGGSWPAFWMIENRISEHPIANDNDFVNWPNPGAGEIDVWEWFSNGPSTYITNFFNTSGCGSEVRYPYPGGAADVQQWHDYAIEWEENSIGFFIDDVMVASHDTTNCVQYKEPMFVLLNVAMGGTLGGPIDPSLATATMEVDYIAHCSTNNSNGLTRCNDSTPQSTTPIISSTPITFVQSNALYTYSLLASDADGDNLTFSAPVLPNWLGFNQATGVLSGTPSSSDLGNHNVTLIVNDGTSLVSQQFTISVSLPPNSTPAVQVNIIPKITSNPILQIKEGVNYQYLLEAIDPDSGVLKVTALILPAWLIFNSSTGLMSGIPSSAEVGSHLVTLTASDGIDEVKQSFNIEVLASEAQPSEEVTAIDSSDTSSSGGGSGNVDFFLLLLFGLFLKFQFNRVPSLKSPQKWGGVLFKTTLRVKQRLML